MPSLSRDGDENHSVARHSLAEQYGILILTPAHLPLRILRHQLNHSIDQSKNTYSLGVQTRSSKTIVRAERGKNDEADLSIRACE